MPSPVKRRGKNAFYRRKNGAWISHGSGFLKVGRRKYTNRVHYAMRKVSSDRKRRARRNKKLRRRYPQAYD